MKFKRLLAALLCVMLLLGAVPVHSSAVQSSVDKKFNIMIVMDCSESIGYSYNDPYGYRYEAASMFLDLLSETGNNVGAVMFSSTYSIDNNSDAVMRQGQKCTGLMSINSQSDKDNLMEQIRSVKPGGYTDIGTALLVAAEQLQGMEAKNGQESIIILFTDGVTDTRDREAYPDREDADLPVYSQSLRNRDKALQMILAEGITLCGVYLSGVDGELENSELLTLVRKANKIDESASENQVGDLYIPIQHAASLTDAYRRFFSLISGTAAQPFEGEQPFRIPGNGVSDVNICVTVQKDTLLECEAALNNLKVTLTRPGGREYTSQELAAIRMPGKSYVILKIQNPEPGPWNVRVECPGTQVQSSILISTTISAEVAYSVAAEDIELNQPITATAKLTQNGKPLTSAEEYQEYTCTLWVQNADTMEKFPVEMHYDASNNTYTGRLSVVNYGQYFVSAEFTCGPAIKVSTPVQRWALINGTPTSPEIQEVPITLSLFSKGIAQIDLSKLVEDPEDDFDDMTVRFDYGKYPEAACNLDGSILTIDGAIGGSGTITVIFADGGGVETSTQLQIVYQNIAARQMKLILLCVGLFLALCILLAISRWARRQLSINLPGVLNLTLPLTTSVMVPLTVQAQYCVNQSLYGVLQDNLGMLVDNAADRRCSADDVNQFLKRNHKVLAKIQITALYNKNTKQQFCRLTGLPGAVRQADAYTQDIIEIPVSTSKIWLEYDRYQ